MKTHEICILALAFSCVQNWWWVSRIKQHLFASTWIFSDFSWNLSSCLKAPISCGILGHCIAECLSVVFHWKAYKTVAPGWEREDEMDMRWEGQSSTDTRGMFKLFTANQWKLEILSKFMDIFMSILCIGNSFTFFLIFTNVGP